MKVLNKIRVKMYLQGTGRENMDRTDLVQVAGTWLVVAKPVMTLRIPKKHNFLTKSGAISF